MDEDARTVVSLSGTALIRPQGATVTLGSFLISSTEPCPSYSRTMAGSAAGRCAMNRPALGMWRVNSSAMIELASRVVAAIATGKMQEMATKV